MVQNAAHWRGLGRQLRGLESMLARPHAVGRGDARAAVLAGHIALLLGFPEGAREGLVDLMVEGYLAEHTARGGTVSEG